MPHQGNAGEDGASFAGEIASPVLYGAMAGVLGRLLLDPPGAEMIDTLAAAGVLLQESPSSHADMVQGMSLLRSFAGTWHHGLAPLLVQDYTRLFVGLERTLAPPFESVYRSEEHLLFEKQTAEVRERYRRFGMTVPARNRIPDDHIGYELQFLAALCSCMDEAVESGEREKVRRCAAEARDFIGDHLSVWLPDFIRRVEEHAETVFYPGVVRLVSGVTAEIQRTAAALCESGGSA
ncbi:molecular chaperone TorD family protein [bacterium]|nr:molecular chaperone TorD family protein [bacterium]